MKRSQGFSLIELLVAITIIAVLSASGMVAYTTANRNARNAKRKSDLQQIRAALELYRTDNPAGYPATLTTLTPYDALDGYLTNPSDLLDPQDSSQYSYTKNPPSGECAGESYSICALLEGNPATTECQCSP